MLSGSMDILVIESPNGILKSSSFHVRFGSLKVIKSKEQIIEIFVNSKKTPITMQLSSSGDAYFIYDESSNNVDSKKKKSFFPTSDQLKQLNLNQGHNEICFISRSSISGIQTLKSSIYLWPSSSKIVISGVDGTITRSEVLGQV